MRLGSLITLVPLLAGLACARLTAQEVGNRRLESIQQKFAVRQTVTEAQVLEELGTNASPQYLTQKTKKFLVNGTAIPDVNFNVGESYAGLLPIQANDTSNQLYYWFFPTSNPQGKDDIIIWLNGGPGCSSLEGFLQENGPFLWQYGTYKPIPNRWSWTKLANMIWVEQPVGTGYSNGQNLPSDETELAEQFAGFWKNFMDTFPDLKGKKIYIAGESYAGFYVPYIADAFFSKNDTSYYNVKNTLIFDGVLTSNTINQQVPVIPFIEKWKDVFGFNETFTDGLRQRWEQCGFKDFRDKYLQFPPPDRQPFSVNEAKYTSGCDIWSDIMAEVSLFNPCFDIYQILTTCPLPWDVLGFPGSFDYTPRGAPKVYFDREEVKKAINAPTGSTWKECTNANVFTGGADDSDPSSYSVLPRVIEKSNRTLIVHGALDFILLPEGSLFAIQNMTWRGQLGFQQKPDGKFFVPYHDLGPKENIAGAGDFGIQHTERGLTYVEVKLTGHMVPQYSPSAAYRLVQYLLERIDRLDV